MNLLAVKAFAMLALLAGLVAGYFGWHHHVFAQGEGKGRAAVQSKWDAATAARQAAEKSAILKREQDNAVEAEKFRETNQLITKAKDAQITQLHHDLDAAPRMRVGPAFCSGPTGPTDPNGASSGITGITGGRLLSPEMDRNIKQMIFEIEQAVATGRAAQEFIKQNGMAKQ